MAKYTIIDERGTPIATAETTEALPDLTAEERATLGARVSDAIEASAAFAIAARIPPKEFDPAELVKARRRLDSALDKLLSAA